MVQTPTDPTKAQVWITKGIDELDFEFYFPQGPKGEPGGFTAASSLGITNLNDIVVPGLYRQSLSTSATTLLNYPTASSGLLEVFEGQNQSDLIQRWTPWGGVAAVGRLMFIRRRDAALAWATWTTYASTRLDQTAGRAIYQWDSINNRDQLIYGDTGWRDISQGAEAGTGKILIRRIGGIVELKFRGSLSSGSGTITYTAVLPAGMKPSHSYEVPYREGASAYGSTKMATIDPVSTNVVFWAVAATSTALVFQTTFSCTDAWPTTLPGIASGSIPNL